MAANNAAPSSLLCDILPSLYYHHFTRSIVASVHFASIVLCHNRVKRTVREIGLTANHQGRLLANLCSWTEVEPRGG